MVKPNLTKEKIVIRLEAMMASSHIIGAEGIADDLQTLVNEIKKDL